MSTLIGPLLWAIVVGLTLWPPFRTGRAGFAVYVVTMAINELPAVFLVIVSLGILSGLGDRPTGALGVAWLLLWGFAVGGLVWAQLRAGRARPALADALERALGQWWTTDLRPDLARGLSAGILWQAGILKPFQRRWPSVERVRDIAYGPDPAHRLDIYRNRRTRTGRPVLIHFHEGGFVQGGKSRESLALLNELAVHGWLSISANYRLGADAAFPNPLVDAKRVIAWVRANAAAHGANPDEVFLAGCSAGGHLALNAALSPGVTRLQPGFEDVDTSVTAAISLYGYLGARSADPLSDPTALAGPGAPPLMLVHGMNDTVLPTGMAEVWAERLRSSTESPVVFAELPGAQHAFDLFASVRARIAANAVMGFLAWVRSTSRER